MRPPHPSPFPLLNHPHNPPTAPPPRIRRLEAGQTAWPFYGGAPCAFAAQNASAPFPGKLVAEGKTRPLRLAATAPAEAGRYMVTALPDGVCGTAAAGYVTPVPAFAEIEVI